ncbi:hypothetical protein [Bradyrhizobium liaoningense]|uniref:hypothetical protein n=1 Tax=Bradyrhizobium liaoningense TaxID=43992 RepID=UPI001BAD25CE|nr:hypothetical protein [Bradyrhizobium liaoningense]MBR0906638.1 hypothetical protein [Bradyrhizobium liaoningense]
MLANPRQSCVALLNPSRGRGKGTTEAFAVHAGESLSLLPICRDVFGVTPLMAGEYLANLFSSEIERSVEYIGTDSLSLWRDYEFNERLARSDVSVIFLGGAFLEEEVLIAALEGVKRGYEVRLLADLVLARREPDRPLVLGRLAHHGIVATAMRHVLFEWAMCCGDPSTARRIQQLLS